MDLLFIPILVLYSVLVWGAVRTNTEEEKDPQPRLSDHAYRGDLSAALARTAALERENQELRKLPEAAEDVRILPDTGSDVSDFAKLCRSRLPDNVRIPEHGRVMAGNGRIWPGNGRVKPNNIRYPWSEDLMPGHYIRVEEIGRYGVVVSVEDGMVKVNFDNGDKQWQRWVRRL